MQKPMEVMTSTGSGPLHRIYWPGTKELLTFLHRLEEKNEGTVPAETSGRNDLYRIQTFAQNLLARDYGIPDISSQAGGKLRALCLQKPMEVTNSTESRPSDKIHWPETMEFLTGECRLLRWAEPVPNPEKQPTQRSQTATNTAGKTMKTKKESTQTSAKRG